MKKGIIIVIVLLIVVAIIVFCLNTLYKRNIDELKNAKYFNNLIQYKTDSINDIAKLDKIIENTELNKYIIKTEKNSNEEKEYLIIYYESIIGNEKVSIIQKNAVTLFSLVNDLEKVIYIDNKKAEENNSFGINSTEGASEEYDRKTINSYFNQDVRNYINKPNDFLKYNIDTNIRNITIYARGIYNNEDWEYKKIEMNEEEKIKTVKELIENQNFGIENRFVESILDIMIDLHNGYVIGTSSGDSHAGYIFKGTGEEAVNASWDKSIYKTLPDGLKPFIESIINSQKNNE